MLYHEKKARGTIYVYYDLSFDFYLFISPLSITFFWIYHSIYIFGIYPTRLSFYVLSYLSLFGAMESRVSLVIVSFLRVRLIG